MIASSAQLSFRTWIIGSERSPSGSALSWRKPLYILLFPVSIAYHLQQTLLFAWCMRYSHQQSSQFVDPQLPEWIKNAAVGKHKGTLSLITLVSPLLITRQDDRSAQHSAGLVCWH